MAHPVKHAESSARKFGGQAEDYLASHNWFDESKAFLSDFRHRALRHHAEGIFLCEKVFGTAITNSDGNPAPVRYVGEQHVKEDLGRIPTAQDWLMQIKPQRWMYDQRLAGSMVKSPLSKVEPYIWRESYVAQMTAGLLSRSRRSDLSASDEIPPVHK